MGGTLWDAAGAADLDGRLRTRHAELSAATGAWHARKMERERDRLFFNK